MNNKIPILMSVLLGACASTPHGLSYDEAPERVEARRCTDICWVMLARNDDFNEARVYITGQRIATLPGLMANDVAIPIRRSMLDGAGCMVVFVKLYPDMKSGYSSRQCPVPGSRLQLAIQPNNAGNSLNLWLNDWRRR